MPRGSHVGERTALLPSLSIQADEVAHAQPAAEPDEAAADDAAASTRWRARLMDVLQLQSEHEARKVGWFFASAVLATSAALS